MSILPVVCRSGQAAKEATIHRGNLINLGPWQDDPSDPLWQVRTATLRVHCPDCGKDHDYEWSLRNRPNSTILVSAQCGRTGPDQFVRVGLLRDYDKGVRHIVDASVLVARMKPTILMPALTGIGSTASQNAMGGHR